jgi:hypothetical protein
VGWRSFRSHDTVPNDIARVSAPSVVGCSFTCMGPGREAVLKTITLSALLFSAIAGTAMAQNTCQSKAIDKNGKPLVGAALTSFMKKCNADYCTSKAIDKNSKPLVGAAKTSFMNKCMSGSQL